MTLDKARLGAMLRSSADMLLDHSGELSRIDSLYGDGDHGVAMSKIARIIEAEVDAWDDDRNAHDFFEALGDKIMSIGGGSAGPLYGTFVGGLAGPLVDDRAVEPATLRWMLQSSRDAMYEITAARTGDKTMMDALIPAVDAALAAPEDFAAILGAAAKAAAAGADASRNMVARFGRARNYKEKTIGTPDAGAISTALFFEGLYKAVL